MHRELVDRAKQGDEEAFDALARAVGDRCMGIAHRILRDAHLAEDAVQAALVVAWRELRTLRDPDRGLRHPIYVTDAGSRASLSRPAARQSSANCSWTSRVAP